MSLARPLDPSVASVFMIDELALRAPKRTDYLQEKRALQDLAARMADHPAEVLPRFVDLAIEMTGGVSGGLSLYESDPAPGIFRWHYLRGTLAPFDGATTPRNFSPCGVTLDQNGPVLVSYPERVYDWLWESKVKLPEVLLVPLSSGEDAPSGTLWIVSDREGHFDSGHARAMAEMATFVGIALRMLRSEHRLAHALEAQETLAKEMSHRLKNVFAMVGGMIRITARGTSTKEEMEEALSGRLQALGSAHALVRRNFSEVGEAPATSDLHELISAILRPHEGAATAKSLISIEGPSIPCGGHAVNGIALIFHELATNSTKYGALKGGIGQIGIDWAHEGEKLVIRWTEHGGPTIDALPEVNGFGSKLLQTTVTRQFGGTVDYDWRNIGLAVTLTLPQDSLSI